MVGEFDLASMCQALGIAGTGLYAGINALLLRRVIGGDSLAHFAGTTVAAALLLLSNAADFDLWRVLVQIALFAAILAAMILHFLAATGRDDGS